MVGMLFAGKNLKTIPRLKFGEVEIPFVDRTKFLGIWIDNKLSWNVQHLLRQSKNMLDKHCLKMLYYAQTFSHIKYRIGIWGSMTSSTLRAKLQKTQTECLKLFLSKNSVWQDAKKFGIFNINNLIKLELNKLGYKMTHHLLPSELMCCMRMDQNNKSLNKTHNYSTRNKAVPNNPKPISKLYHNSFLCKSLTEYQTFMVATAHCKNYNHFVSCCKKLLHDM